MKRIILATSMLLVASFIASTAEAQPCCWGYRVRYYRVQPYYQYLHYAPPPPPRWSIGLHVTGITTNQMFDDDAVILGGAGGHLRLRSYRWAGELAVDVVGGKYLNGHISRVSAPIQLSAMLYLVPEGRFNLYLIGGMRVQPTTMKLNYPTFKREQTFAEFGLHGGIGAEIVLGHNVALTTDLRFFGMLRDDSAEPGKFYEGVHDGVLPRDTIGLQLNAGVSFRF